MSKSASVILVAALVAALGASVGSRTGTAATRARSRIVFAANQLPRWYGEIYRVTANGRRIDLSRSPAADLSPAVSPDGRWVAFLSGRRGHWAIYVVGNRGQGLHRVSSPLGIVSNGPVQAWIAWARDSRRLAATVGDDHRTLGLLGDRISRLRVVVRGAPGGGGRAGVVWSPDGRLIAYSQANLRTLVTSAGGKRLWSASGVLGADAWSIDDRLAVSDLDSSIVRVYTRNGRRAATFRGSWPSWSPGGSVLASLSRFALQIRREGTGQPIQRWPIRGSELRWADRHRLRVMGDTGWFGFDIARNRTWSLTSPATTNYDSVVAPSGAVAAEQPTPDFGAELVLAAPGSSDPRVIARAPCSVYDGYGSFAGLALSPRGLIYQTSCDTPPADIYSIRPDGTGLRRITATSADEMQPSLSPDGTMVVFSQEITAGRCDGCAYTLWLVPANGGIPTQLTRHLDTAAAPFDESPSWSPDGHLIAYQNSGANSPIRLATIPAAGGARTLGPYGVSMPTWGPRLIAYVDSKGRLKTRDPRTGTIRTVARGGPYDVGAFAWSKSGRLAYLYYDTQGRAFVATVGSRRKPLSLSVRLSPHAQIAGLAWSPDGWRFAFAATDINGVSDIYTVGTDGRDLRRITTNIGARFIVRYQGSLSWR